MLNARAGGISHKDVVMPIDLIFDEIEKVSAALFRMAHRLTSLPEIDQGQRVQRGRYRMYGNSRRRTQTICRMGHTIPARPQTIRVLGWRLSRRDGRKVLVCYRPRDPGEERLCNGKCRGGGVGALGDVLCGERKISPLVRGPCEGFDRLSRVVVGKR